MKPSTPPVATPCDRASQRAMSAAGRPRCAGVTITSPRTRSGWVNATARAVADPMDWPISVACPAPAASSTATASSARVGTYA